MGRMTVQRRRRGLKLYEKASKVRLGVVTGRLIVSLPSQIDNGGGTEWLEAEMEGTARKEVASGWKLARQVY